LLNQDCHPGDGIEPEFSTVGESSVAASRTPHLDDRGPQVGFGLDPEHGEVLAGKAHIRRVFIDCRGTGCQTAEWAKLREAGSELGVCLGVAAPHGGHEGVRQGEASRRREPMTQRSAELDRFAPELARVVGVVKCGDLHASTRTVPASPSISTRAPSGMSAVASREPTTPGMPYSRETMAGWERIPPRSVTTPASRGSSTL